jgi:hypothetical protein
MKTISLRTKRFKKDHWRILKSHFCKNIEAKKISKKKINIINYFKIDINWNKINL